MKCGKIKHSTNLIFTQNFFLIALYQILQNYAILINHESFFQEKESSQLYRTQFLRINSLTLKPLKINFRKRNSYKKIAEFGNNLFNLGNWKRLCCRESFP